MTPSSAPTCELRVLWRNVALMTLAVLAMGVLIVLSSGEREVRARVTPESERAALADVGLTAPGSYLAERFAVRRHDFEAAAILAERALQMDPGAPGLTRDALLLFVATDQWSKAGEIARRIVRKAPRDHLARMALGINALRRGDYATARRHFTKAAVMPVGVHTGGTLAAWTWLAAGGANLQQAFKALKALDSFPFLSGVKLQHQAMMADYAQQNMRAAALYRKAWKQLQGYARLALAYGNFLRRQGKGEEAEKLYRETLKNWTDDPLVKAALAEVRAHPERKPTAFIRKPEDGMAEAVFQLAGGLYDKQDFFRALLYVRMTLALRPDLPEAWLLLGRIEEAQERLKQALAAYGHIPQDHPLYLQARLRVAQVQFRLKKTDLAIAELHALSRRHPDNYTLFILLGDLLRSQKRWQDAGEAYSRAIALLEKRGMKRWQLYYNRGITHERAGQWALAERDFIKALELKPDQPSVLNYYGYSLIERGERLKEALRMVRKAVQLRPDDGYIIDSLGWAYFKLGKYGDAVRELENAVFIRPEDPVINDHLGDAYWMVGRRLEARFQWQHALDGSPPPEPELKKKLLKKLKSGLTGGMTQPHADPAPLANGGKASEPKG